MQMLFDRPFLKILDLDLMKLCLWRTEVGMAMDQRDGHLGPGWEDSPLSKSMVKAEVAKGPFKVFKTGIYRRIWHDKYRQQSWYKESVWGSAVSKLSSRRMSWLPWLSITKARSPWEPSTPWAVMVSVHIRCILAADHVATCESCPTDPNRSQQIPTDPNRSQQPKWRVMTESAITWILGKPRSSAPLINKEFGNGFHLIRQHLGRRTRSRAETSHAFRDNVFAPLHWKCMNMLKFPRSSNTTMSASHKTWPRSIAHRGVDQQLVIVF